MVVSGDPRLDGWLTTNETYHRLRAGDTFSGSLRSGIGQITNEGGSWAVSFHGFSMPAEHTKLHRPSSPAPPGRTATKGSPRCG